MKNSTILLKCVITGIEVKNNTKKRVIFEKIRDSYNSELIKVIMGIRRCGKSVLLLQIIEELKQKGIKENHIIYIYIEDYDFIEYTE